jgi:hypothetical protein
MQEALHDHHERESEHAEHRPQAEEGAVAGMWLLRLRSC